MYIKINLKKKSKRKSYKTFRRCIALNLSLLSLSTSILPYFQSACASNLNNISKINTISAQAAKQSKNSVISKIMISGPVIATRATFLFNKISGYGKFKVL